MQKVFRVTVDISKKIPAPAFEVNTNDLKSVKLEITITNGQSLLDLTDVTPRINIRKPDNEVIFQDCEIVDAKAGKVQIVLENQAYLVPGTHTAEIACYKGNEITAITGTFSYKSVKGIMNDEAVESKSEFTAIDRKIEAARKLLEDIGENGVGVDEQARRKIEEVTEQLAETVKEVNGVKPANGKITIPVPEVDTSKLATKTELQAVASGAPKAASRISEMTDRTKNYVYIGSEAGYTAGNWYYHNGTSWVSGGVYQATQYDGFPATNKVVNGNFKNGISSWSGSGATISVNNQVLTLTGSGASTTTQVLQTTLQDSIEGHILHIKFKATVRNSDVATLGFHLLGTTGAKYNVRTISKPQLDQLIEIDYRHTLDSSFTGKIKIAIFATYANNAAATDKKIEIENVFIHDLTETFGQGKEPTEEQLNDIMSHYPNKWFDGTIGSLLSTKGIYDYFLTKVNTKPITPVSDNTFVDPNTGKTYSYYFAINPDGTVSIKYEEAI